MKNDLENINFYNLKLLVSVIVPCYYQAQYLEDALRSVLEQTYTNWECIVVDDGSPDNTKEIVKKWLDKDNRFRYIYQKNTGVSSARNLGIRNAKGEFILPLDADDYISPDYLQLAMNEFLKNDKLKVLYSKARKVGANNTEWNLKKFSLYNLALENMIFVSGVYRKEDWAAVNGYDKNLINGLEDWEFWISILKFGGEVKQLDKICFYYRVKENSRNKSISKEMQLELETYISYKHFNFFIAQLGSFPSLGRSLGNIKKEHIEKLNSEKFVVDLFCKRFFGFSLFQKYKG